MQRRLPADYEQRLDDLVDEIYEVASQTMTWAELAAASGLAYSTVCRLGERITRLPQLKTIYQLARAVDMEVQLKKKRLRVRRVA